MNSTNTFHYNSCSSADSPSFIITQFPSDKYVISQTALCIVNCVLIIPAILLNGACVLTILTSPPLKEKICFFLIAVQSMIDLGVALLTLPSITYIVYSELIGTLECVVIFALTFTALVPGGLSLAALCALTFERYMGIVHPFAHRVHVTKKKFLFYFLGYSVILFIGVPLSANSAIVYYFGMITVIGLSLILNSIAYTRIFIRASQGFKSTVDNNGENSNESNSSENDMKRRFLRESKLAKSCAIVVGVFYICYLPGLVVCLYYIQTNKLIYRVVHSWYTANIGLNSSINSIVFFWQRAMLRNEAARVFKRIFGYGNSGVSDGRSGS